MFNPHQTELSRQHVRELLEEARQMQKARQAQKSASKQHKARKTR